MTSTRLTATDPMTGTVYARTTAADYRFVSLRDGVARWHGSHAAASKTGGRIITVDGPTVAEPEAAEVECDEGAVCTITNADGICGEPAVVSFSSSRNGERFHECAAHKF